ncbi:MAG TPA: hypothetical protein VGZ47_04590, partial [Gemmataceae bacterium]|nr:hypothetical protein [Gemmataceae bacterium]
VVLFLRWRSIWMWFVWFAITGLSVGALFMLRTPAASVTEHGAQGVEIIGYEGWTIGDIKFASAPNSLAEIEELIGKGGKPTLVEIYADWGFA